jgi:hypothetical protein
MIAIRQHHRHAGAIEYISRSEDANARWLRDFGDRRGCGEERCVTRGPMTDPNRDR